VRPALPGQLGAVVRAGEPDVIAVLARHPRSRGGAQVGTVGPVPGEEESGTGAGTSATADERSSGRGFSGASLSRPRAAAAQQMLSCSHRREAGSGCLPTMRPVRTLSARCGRPHDGPAAHRASSGRPWPARRRNDPGGSEPAVFPRRRRSAGRRDPCGHGPSRTSRWAC
jgi:hypothetical protein